MADNEEYVPISERPSPVEVNLSPEQQWAQERMKELDLEVESKPEEVPETEEAVVEEATPAISEEPKESYTRSARKFLELENKLRTQREDFKKQKAEHEEALAAFNKAKQFAEIDPFGYLASLGIGGDKLLEASKSYYLSTVEDLDPSFKQQLDLQKQQREMLREQMEWKAKMEAEFKEKQESAAQQANVAKVNSYVQSLADTAVAIDESAYPMVAKYADSEAAQNEVFQNLYAEADAHYRNTGEFMDVSNMLGRMEKKLQSMVNKFTPAASESTPENKVVEKTKVKGSLQNTVASIQTTEDPDLDWENDYETAAKAVRDRAFNRHFKNGLNS